MTTLVAALENRVQNHPLRAKVLKWQCRVRQIAMRENLGRPDEAITPAVLLPGETEPIGHVITLITKTPRYSVTPELKHLFAKTNDPAQRRDHALQFLSATYYQKHAEFSDVLTATFPPSSGRASMIASAGRCVLIFTAYAQRFDLDCTVAKLAAEDPLFQATWWHNRLFNPELHPATVVLAFKPDWEHSSSGPVD